MSSLIGGQTGNASRLTSGIVAGQAKRFVEVEAPTSPVTPSAVRYVAEFPDIFMSGTATIAMTGAGALAVLVKAIGNALLSPFMSGNAAVLVTANGGATIPISSSGTGTVGGGGAGGGISGIWDRYLRHNWHRDA